MQTNNKRKLHVLNYKDTGKCRPLTSIILIALLTFVAEFPLSTNSTFSFLFLLLKEAEKPSHLFFFFKGFC